MRGAPNRIGRPIRTAADAPARVRDWSSRAPSRRERHRPLLLSPLAASSRARRSLRRRPRRAAPQAALAVAARVEAVSAAFFLLDILVNFRTGYFEDIVDDDDDGDGAAGATMTTRGRGGGGAAALRDQREVLDWHVVAWHYLTTWGCATTRRPSDGYHLRCERARSGCATSSLPRHVGGSSSSALGR